MRRVDGATVCFSQSFMCLPGWIGFCRYGNLRYDAIRSLRRLDRVVRRRFVELCVGAFIFPPYTTLLM